MKRNTEVNIILSEMYEEEQKITINE